MNELTKVFDYEGKQIRTVTLKDGEPGFVAKDVCEYFGDTNYRRSVSRLDEDEKGVSHIDTPGGKQQMTIINESGLYSLLFGMQPQKSSTTDEQCLYRIYQIHKFKRWITHEVLPAIRKTGSYSTRKNPDAILSRKINLLGKLSRGLPEGKQLELRIIAVKQASEESGTDYSDILAVLEPEQLRCPSATDDIAAMFISEINSKIDKYQKTQEYLLISSPEVSSICSRLGLSRTLVLRELYKQGLIKSHQYRKNNRSFVSKPPCNCGLCSRRYNYLYVLRGER